MFICGVLGAPVLFVKKQDGGLSIWIEYWQLNKVTIQQVLVVKAVSKIEAVNVTTPTVMTYTNLNPMVGDY